MRTAFVVTLVHLAALGSTARAQTLVGSIAGNPGNRFGAAVISAGFQDADTYADLLVGSPTTLTGNIRCISGRYLATGVGSSTLWMVDGPVNPPGVSGGFFGASIASVGNLTGNSATDFVVGSPTYKFNPFGVVTGAVHLVDGSTHAVVATIYGDNNTQLGSVVVSVGDQNGDGKAEIAATAPSTNGQASYVHVIQGSTFSGTKSLASSAHSSLNNNGATEFGETIASGFDLDGDGKRDLAIGSPQMGSGSMFVVRPDTFTTLAAYSGAGGGEHMGAAISASHDYNGDGVVDFVVGAPHWSTDHATADGRAVVLSGANLRSYTLPYELATFSLTQGGVATYLFGDAVRASPDLNRDGVGDFLIGAPAYFPTFPSGAPKKGAVFVYSGATMSHIASIYGANNDRLGDNILGGFQDVTGDLFPEFVVAGSFSDNPVTDCGVIKLYNLFPLVPSAYCVGKLNSQGCTPAMGSSGSPSASAGVPFTLSCANVINQISGLFFYSNQATAVPFQGGTLCVKTPLKRSAVQASGGSASGVDCTGTFTWDFGARIQSGVDPALVAGAEVFAQCWSRDSASPSTTSLSNGRRFFINP